LHKPAQPPQSALQKQAGGADANSVTS